MAGVKSRSDERVEGAGSHRRIWRREQRSKDTRRRDGEVSTFIERLTCQRRGPMVADDLERAKDREPCAPVRGPGVLVSQTVDRASANDPEPGDRRLARDLVIAGKRIDESPDFGRGGGFYDHFTVGSGFSGSEFRQVLES